MLKALWCWLTDEHVPTTVVRLKPRREVTVCRRCWVMLSVDPWDKSGDGPRRAA